jgi:hypothetical protein
VAGIAAQRVALNALRFAGRFPYAAAGCEDLR